MASSFESTLFKTADKLRKNMDAAEYKHIVLGLIFLKYISGSFEDLHDKLKKGDGENDNRTEGANGRREKLNAKIEKQLSSIGFSL